ncbi:MAG TPA: sialidase family protein, partial [Polyangiaceae bacterium]
PFVDLLVLGVARQGLWSSTDGGATFGKLGASGDMILNRLSFVVWDPDNAKVFWASGIYGWESPFTDGVFKTTDQGASFSGYKKLSAIQSTNDSVSVDFTDPDRKVMLSGGHEQAGVFFRSTDAGVTWTDIGPSFPANIGFCTTALVLDAKTLLVGCAASYSGKNGAVLRSTNGGDAWTQVHDKGVFGQPLWASDGSIYWAAEGGGIDKSTDQGVTFTQVADGNTAGAVRPIELPGGRIVSIAQRVLKGSIDGGKSWQAIGTALPFDANVLGYSPFRRAFYASRFDCTTAVPADAIERYGFDFKQ